jgi:glycogen debranching enzyme
LFDNSNIITSGSTFVISSENGDIIPGTPEGFYAEDTRFLSSFRILIDGKETSPVSSYKTNHSISSFYSTFLTYEEVYGLLSSSEDSHNLPSLSSLSIVRDRMVVKGLHEDLTVKSHAPGEKSFKLEVQFDADFADVFEVRRGVFRKFGRIGIENREECQICFRYESEDFHRESWVSLTGRPKIEGNRAVFELKLGPKDIWKTCIEVYPVVDTKPTSRSQCVGFMLAPPFGSYRKKSDPSSFTTSEVKGGPLASSTPKLFTDSTDLHESYLQAISDLRSLQLELIPDQYVLAAGLPWFMALFGRDSIISAIQTKILGTGFLTGTLRTLSTLQATTIDKFREAEPGKIPHEVRRGELSMLSRVPHSCYYGSVDATPLFVILLWEAFQWTGDEKLLTDHVKNAEAALAWCDTFGDLDRDGFVEYSGSSKEGLRNQGWKDSDDCVSFSSGELAEQPIALAEVQGYVYAAKTRMAQMNRMLGNFEAAKNLESEADSLKEKFNREFWMPKEQYFAMGLDGKKQQVNSITSNPGHCLWTGIIEEHKARRVVQRLLRDDMFTGWGIRTLSSEMARYNPISYHNGSVWPHDNSIIAKGLSWYGFYEEANTLALSLIDAASKFNDHRLPELFAGYVRREGSKPVPYPAANSPQAWASGALVFSIETLLGIAESGEDLMQLARPEGMNISMGGVVYRGRRLEL